MADSRQHQASLMCNALAMALFFPGGMASPPDPNVKHVALSEGYGKAKHDTKQILLDAMHGRVSALFRTEVDPVLEKVGLYHAFTKLEKKATDAGKAASRTQTELGDARGSVERTRNGTQVHATAKRKVERLEKRLAKEENALQRAEERRDKAKQKLVQAIQPIQIQRHVLLQHPYGPSGTHGVDVKADNWKHYPSALPIPATASASSAQFDVKRSRLDGRASEAPRRTLLPLDDEDLMAYLLEFTSCSSAVAGLGVTCKEARRILNSRLKHITIPWRTVKDWSTTALRNRFPAVDSVELCPYEMRVVTAMEFLTPFAHRLKRLKISGGFEASEPKRDLLTHAWPLLESLALDNQSSDSLLDRLRKRPESVAMPRLQHMQCWSLEAHEVIGVVQGGAVPELRCVGDDSNARYTCSLDMSVSARDGVSSSFIAAVQLWPKIERLCVRFDDRTPYEQAVDMWTRAVPLLGSIRSLTLTCSRPQLAARLLNASAQGPRASSIQELKLKCENGIDASTLALAPSTFIALGSLRLGSSLTSCPLSPDAAKAILCSCGPQLTSLSLERRGQWRIWSTIADDANIAWRKSLRTLHVQGEPVAVSDIGMASRALAALEGLQGIQTRNGDATCLALALMNARQAGELRQLLHFNFTYGTMEFGTSLLLRGWLVHESMASARGLRVSGFEHQMGLHFYPMIKMMEEASH